MFSWLSSLSGIFPSSSHGHAPKGSGHKVNPPPTLPPDWFPLDQRAVRLSSVSYLLSLAVEVSPTRHALNLATSADLSELQIIHDSLPEQKRTAFSSPIPVVLLTVPDTPTEFQPQAAIARLFDQGDDVLSEDFLGNTVILQGETEFAVSQCARDGVDVKVKGKSWKPQRIIRVVHNSPSLRSGPYFLLPEGVLAQAYRLYPDTHDAFCASFVPDTTNEKPYS